MATAVAATAQRSNMSEQTGPRKRRKRTTAAGAAADCFTCASRNARCDRRRPYCSQCLETGQDCAGYKTQLTWGVGVASRGKLRGLSLPVAGTAKVEGANSSTNTKKRSESNGSGIGPLYRFGQNAGGSASGSDQRAGVAEFPASEPRTSDINNHWAYVVVNNSSGVEALNNTRRKPGGFHHDTPASTDPDYYTRYTESHFTQIPLSRPREGNNYDSQNIPYLQTSQDQHLPISPSSSAAVDQMSFAYVTPFLPSPEMVSFPESPINSAHSRTGEEVNGFSNVFQPALRSQTIPPKLHKGDYDEEVRRESLDDGGGPDDDSWLSSPYTTGLQSPLFVATANQGIGQTPRMQYLINYYAEVIAPVIVAFDNASNPFRFEVLRLAANSESLQHAIAALSASNLRQRRGIALSTGKTDSARRSSMAHVNLTDANNGALLPLLSETQIGEESYHKRWAVTHLNKHLADTRLRRDDSILATLLILCLFHICDSGIAKFQTQFAGVKKLLAVRGDEFGLANEGSKWMARLFTWLDSLTATVNDRESQFPELHLEMSFVNGDCPLERLAGVDGRLSKIIAKLGRLNVLRQGMSVAPSTLMIPKPAPAFPTQTPFDPNHFDGNGWVRIAADENLFNAKDRPGLDNIASHPATHNTQFWREWREIRHELQLWSSNDSTVSPPYLDATGTRFTPEQLVDLHHISNSFRYAALLYTERLSNPTTLASSEDIQLWVRKALSHIQQVQSDVYLLWPLFIAGSECVTEPDRDVIRGRCADIQKDSGFVNNRSCLDLLEKLWAKMDQQVSGEGHYCKSGHEQDGEVLAKTPFKFREVMMDERNEGEYIVV